MVDLRPHLVALGVVEASRTLVGEGDVRCPPQWKASALGAEDHELEAETPAIVPYLVLDGRIVPPIDLAPCTVSVEPVIRSGARGTVDCSGATRAVLTKLSFEAK